MPSWPSSFSLGLGCKAYLRISSYFRERTLYYSTWPIQAQGRRGKWDYEINAVYVVSILDFLADSDQDNDRIVRCKKILDVSTLEPWTDKLLFFNIEIPRFRKTLHECTSFVDRWFFALRHLHKLLEKPVDWQEDVFSRLFAVSDKSKFDETDLDQFEHSEAEYDTMKNALDYAIKEGKAEGHALGLAEGRTEGRAEGRAEGRTEALLATAGRLLAKGMSLEEVSDATGLAIEEIQTLLVKK